MDSILAKRLITIFNQPNVLVEKIEPKESKSKKISPKPQKSKTPPKTKRIKLKKNKFNIKEATDPILEKHLIKVFKNNQLLTNDIKSNTISKEVCSNTIVKEIADVNKKMSVPPKKETLPPSIIDAYRASIQPLPPTREFSEENPEDSENSMEYPVNSSEEFGSTNQSDFENSDQDIYVKAISDTEPDNRLQDQKIKDNEFFQFLERNKDNPQLKNFFNSHSETMKKEIIAISENFTKEKMLMASESGGGSGNITYNTTNTGVAKKHIEVIGNGSDIEFFITHNFDTKEVSVTLYDNLNDQIIIAYSENINNNETRISFSEPIPTNSIRVVLLA